MRQKLNVKTAKIAIFDTCKAILYIEKLRDLYKIRYIKNAAQFKHNERKGKNNVRKIKRRSLQSKYGSAEIWAGDIYMGQCQRH